jgi:predicted phosphoribosyltransferase
VLALPRGGVPVAAEVAQALDAPLDLALVRKIGAPDDPEFADGPEPVVVRNAAMLARFGVSEVAFAAAAAREIAELDRRRALYLRGRHRIALTGRTVIVVDDGIATGATVTAALRAIRAQQPKWLVLAAPVAAGEAVELVRDEADEVVVLETPADFGAVGLFYEDFAQLDDGAVVAALAESPAV